MKEYLLYCAGPIKGLSYEQAVSWRNYIAQKLPSYIRVVSPMRGKDYLKNEKRIIGSYEKYPLSSKKGITCRDRNDVMRCDMMLLNFLGAREVSIGSVIEIGWADAFRKPIILAMEKDNIHCHPMIEEVAGFIVPTLDEAIEIIVSVLSPGV
jgi:nucleoside 2-deoxyribosyltransferase